jgi:hypothetical protein
MRFDPLPVVVLFLLSSMPFRVWADPTDFSSRYGVSDPYTKIVDNQGKGEERLYGVRNARLLFRNILRGGANNAFHRDHPRENQNPLPDDALKHLCEEGFTDAFYLYSKNFKTAPVETQCVRENGTPGKLRYRQLTYNRSETEILTRIRELLLSGEGGLYLHCWNGWHASGYLSAISRMQFCGVSSEEAVDYWNRNTDGVNVGENYDRIRAKIRDFRVREGLGIPEEIRKRACIY